MAEPREDVLVKPKDIIIKGEKVDFINIKDVIAHVQRRQGLFLSRLASITSKIYGGWQSVSQTGEGTIVKKPSIPYEEGVFTGKNFCQLGAYALGEGLSQLDVKHNFTVRAVELRTDLHAENWNNKSYILQPMMHQIVEVRENNSGETVYFDPTYGQVDHRTTGTILVAKPEEIDKFYRLTRMSARNTIADAESERNMFLKQVNLVGVNPKQYAALVDTLK